MGKIIALSLLLYVNLLNAHGDDHGEEDMLIKGFTNLGLVNFSTSCNQEVNSSINTALALLHHMMYKQSEKTFKQIMNEHPDCAMAYWGFALSLFHPLWPDTISNESLTKGEQALKKALSFNNFSNREAMYLNAAKNYYENWQETKDIDRILAWENAQKLIHQSFPEDIDATALYALSHIATASMSDKTLSHQKTSGALLDKLYQIAPDVPHALHMPSHIFVRLGMWNDVVSWNLRSAKAALNYPSNGSTSLHYVHAIDYLNYAYLQLGKYKEVQHQIDLLGNHHNYQDVFPVAYALAAIPARQVLEQKQWLLAKDLKPRQPNYLSWDNYPQVEAISYYTKGLGAARNGELEIAQQNIDVLNELVKKTLKVSSNYWAKLIDAQIQTIQAWISYSKGDSKLALKQLTHAADLEDSLDKNPVTPGSVLPARELLGDMLVMNNDFKGALAAYKKTLVINPNRLNSLNGVDYCQSKLVL